MTTGPAPEAAALLRRLDDIEASRDRLLEELRALPEGGAAGRPAADVWSAQEVVEHLVLAERTVMRGLFDPSYLKPRGKSLKNRILRRVVMWILSGPVKVKVPSVDMEPTGERSLEELAPEWRETHRRLRTFLEEADAQMLTSGCFRHPVSGPLTPEEAMAMLSTHMERHAAQIRGRLDGA